MYENTRREDFDSRWWTLEGEGIWDSLSKTITVVLDEDERRQRAYRTFQRMYGDTHIWGSGVASATSTPLTHRVTLNVIANCVDFVTSRIGKHQPMPRPIVRGGNFTLSKKAKLLERFLNAQYRISKVWAASRVTFRDTCLFGTGIIYPHMEDGNIIAERIYPADLLIDQVEAHQGKPRQFYLRRYMSKEALKELYPDKEIRIDEACPEWADSTNHIDPAWQNYKNTGDLVLVMECWYVHPEGKGKKVTAVSSGILEEEAYKEDVPPFVFLHWKPSLRGFWGIGMARELADIQTEINRMLLRFQQALQLVAVPRIFISASSKVSKKHFTDQIGSFVPYVGEKPVFHTPTAMGPEYFQYLQWLYQRAFEIIGVTQDSVNARMGKGESGLARQAQHDIETDRFSIVAQDFEEFSLEIADRIIRICKDNPKLGAAAERDKYSVETIAWKDINMSEDEYILQVMPVSNLPDLPGGRIDRILQLVNGGLMDPTDAKDLIDLPDLEKKYALDQAAKHNIERILESIVDDAAYEAPEPFMDIQLAMKMAQDEYNRFKASTLQDSDQEAVEERLELLRKFLRACGALQRQAELEQMKVAMAAAAQQGTPPAPGPGAPPATGPNGAPPTAVGGAPQ
jgi:hypothetical protein